MNAYYIAAIVLTAAAAFCAYKGTTLQNRNLSSEQTARIEAQLKNLGNKIQEAKQKGGDQVSSTAIEDLQQEYESIAKRFFNGLPIKVEEKKVRDTERTIEQLKKSREVEAHIQKLEQEALAMVAGFNKANSKVQLSVLRSEIPVNIYENLEKYRFILSFGGISYWLIRFSTFDEILSLQFVRVKGAKNASLYEVFEFSNDSILLVFSDDKFSISLNRIIANEIKSNVIGDIQLQPKLMSEFDSTAKTILQRIIEHEIVIQSLTDT